MDKMQWEGMRGGHNIDIDSGWHDRKKKRKTKRYRRGTREKR